MPHWSRDRAVVTAVTNRAIAGLSRMPALDALLIVVAVAFAAPFLLGLAPWLRVPAVVLEIVAGIARRPVRARLGRGRRDDRGDRDSSGSRFLLFLAGLEIDFDRLRGRVLRLDARGFALVVRDRARASRSGSAPAGWSRRRCSSRSCSCSTSLGVLIPVLKDAGEIDSPLGQLVIAARLDRRLRRDHPALALLLRRGRDRARRCCCSAALLGLAVAVVSRSCAAPSARCGSAPTWCELQDTTAQIRVRGAMVLFVGFAAVAEQLGLEVILGTFIAGAILSLARPRRAR